MGLVFVKGLVIFVLLLLDFFWDVFFNWMLEEVVLVFVVYSMVYYVLVVCGWVCFGEMLFIYLGLGGVGQVVIVIVFSLGCCVFIIVGLVEKWVYFQVRFFQFDSISFVNFWDIFFEQYVLWYMGGKGVDLVLNFLVEEKLQVSVRCLVMYGCFLEIGKFDFFQNYLFGMVIFLKNVIFYGVLLDVFFNESSVDWWEVWVFVQVGIWDGVVWFFKCMVFYGVQVEDVFCYMV